MRATFVYTLARLAIFAAVTGLMYVAGLRGILLVGLALVASGALSYVLLSRLRDSMASSIAGRMDRARARLAAGARAEDTD